MTEPDIRMDLTSIRMKPHKYEQSPVQVLGTVNGYPFLFYARWDFWEFSIPLNPNVDLYSVTSAGGGFYREGDYGPEGGNAVDDMPNEWIVETIRQCAGAFAMEHPANNSRTE